MGRSWPDISNRKKLGQLNETESSSSYVQDINSHQVPVSHWNQISLAIHAEEMEPFTTTAN